MGQGPSIRVVKLGGSLLQLENLRDQFETWMARQEPMINLLVVGGGVWVEALRECSRLHHFTEEQSHWLAIELMEATGRVAAEILGGLPLVAEATTSALCRGGERTQVLQLGNWLKSSEPQEPGQRLLHSWSVTSDSIAARFASVCGAQELVLLKSRPATSASWEELASEGYVDASFPSLVGSVIRCRAVTLVAERACQ